MLPTEHNHSINQQQNVVCTVSSDCFDGAEGAVDEDDRESRKKKRKREKRKKRKKREKRERLGCEGYDEWDVEYEYGDDDDG